MWRTVLFPSPAPSPASEPEAGDSEQEAPDDAGDAGDDGTDIDASAPPPPPGGPHCQAPRPVAMEVAYAGDTDEVRSQTFLRGV